MANLTYDPRTGTFIDTATGATVNKNYSDQINPAVDAYNQRLRAFDDASRNSSTPIYYTPDLINPGSVTAPDGNTIDLKAFSGVNDQMFWSGGTLYSNKDAYMKKTGQAPPPPNSVNVGTAQAPLYVPAGSAGDKLSSGIKAGTVSPTDPNQQMAASMQGNNVNDPGIVPQAPNAPAQPATPTQPGAVQGQPGASGQKDATLGQNPMQVGGKFGTQNFGRVGNDVVEIMSDGSHRKVSEAEFRNTLQAQGLNLDVLPQVTSNVSFESGTPSGPAGSGPDGIMGTADDLGAPKGPSSFIQDYTGVLKELGISSIKSQLADIQKQYKDLQNEKLEKIADVNMNPWLSEAGRSKKVSSINSTYEGKEGNLTAQLKLYESLYEEGLAQAKFITSGLQEDRNKLLDLALKREEAENKYASGIIGEYQYAVKNGYKGSFIQYQNEDANRKANISLSLRAAMGKAVSDAKTILEASRRGGQFIDGNEFLRLRTYVISQLGTAKGFDEAYVPLLSESDRNKYFKTYKPDSGDDELGALIEQLTR